MKRLLTSLFAGAMLFAGLNAEAKVPVISALPDIQIGNMEDFDPSGPKMFVFTNAFDFDTKVLYKGAAANVADLNWSFAEFNDPDNSTHQWFTINSVDPIAVGDSAVVAAENAKTPNNPGVKDIRAAGTGATFRDVVLSPASGDAPTPEQLSQHALGKIVRFYVSDGAGVAKKDVLVKSVDGAYDETSYPEYDVDIWRVDDMDGVTISGTSSTSADWWWTKTTMNIGMTAMPDPLYSSSAKAIQLRTGTNNLDSTKTKLGYLTLDLVDNVANRLKWSDIGATAEIANTKIVRAKYWIYAGGQSSSGQPAQTIQIPNVRFKIQTNYMIANALEVFPGNINQFAASGTQMRPQDYELVKQIAPSTDSANPSAYRVDMKPFNASYIYANNLQSNQDFAFMRAVELYQNMPFMNGSLYLTESWVGTYSAEALAPANGTLMKTFSGDALKNWGTSTSYTTAQQNADTTFNNGATYYSGITYTGLGKDTSNPLGTQSTDLTKTKVTWSSTGVALDARSFQPSASNGTVGLLVAEIPIIAKASGSWTAADYANVVRVARDKVYMLRFTANNPYVAAANMPDIQFRGSVYFYWTQRFEVNAANTFGDSATGKKDLYIRSCMPGSTAKTYDVILQSPMNSEIQADQSLWDAAPGYGVAQVSDIRNIGIIGVSMIDTLSGNDNEKGYMNLSKVEVYEFDLVED